MQTRYVLTGFITSLILLESVKAHGGEASDGLSNLQITLISAGLSALCYIGIKFLWGTEMNNQTRIMLSAVTYTGAVHIMLGLDDIIFLLGGLGIVGFGFAPLAVGFARSNQKIFDIALSLNASIMFVAYFVSKHDLHGLMEDYLGITTKLAEIAILVLVYKKIKAD